MGFNCKNFDSISEFVRVVWEPHSGFIFDSFSFSFSLCHHHLVAFFIRHSTALIGHSLNLW